MHKCYREKQGKPSPYGCVQHPAGLEGAAPYTRSFPYLPLVVAVLKEEAGHLQSPNLQQFI